MFIVRDMIYNNYFANNNCFDEVMHGFRMMIDGEIDDWIVSIKGNSSQIVRTIKC